MIANCVAVEWLREKNFKKYLNKATKLRGLQYVGSPCRHVTSQVMIRDVGGLQDNPESHCGKRNESHPVATCVNEVQQLATMV